MRKAPVVIAALLVAASLHAAPPAEPVQAQVQEVNVAGREFVADGVSWTLSSTAAIRVPGRTQASLRDVKPGMNVRLELGSADDPVPVVRSLTVLAD